MRLAFVTSSRSDFGLIRPLLKRAAGKGPGAALVCLGPACSLDPAEIGVDGVEIVKLLPASPEQRMSSASDTVASFSALCAAFSGWLSAKARAHDWLVLPGDRFEIFAACVAGYYLSQPMAHLFAGDRSEGGHLDDNTRHCISKLSSVHLAVSADSRERVLRLGEEPWRVHDVGSPVVESVQEAVAEAGLADGIIMPDRKNILCTYHPIGTEPEAAGRQFAALVQALTEVQERTGATVILTYPNNENGSRAIVAEIESLKGRPGWSFHESLGWRKYLNVLNRCDLVVGNSSSALLEAPIVGVPALDVGTRQRGRLAPQSVRRHESYDPSGLAAAMGELLSAPRGAPSHPYGDGSTSSRVWSLLEETLRRKSRLEILQKRMTY